MTLTLNDFTVKLINKILFAPTQEDVKKFINDATDALDQNKVNGHIVARFVDKMVNELEQFNPMNKDAQQWSNIRLSKIIFYRIRHQLNATVH